MQKSATEVMEEALFAAVIDAIVALKAASKGLPNNLLRDLNAIHANTTFADLPPDLRASISASVRPALARLLREGYSVSPAAEARPPRPPRPEGPRRADGARRGPPPKRGAPDGRGPRGPRREGGRPPRKPGPR